MHSSKAKSRCLIVLCFLLMFTLVGCQESTLLIDDELGERYTLSNEITFHSAILRSINPVNSRDADFYQIGKLLYDSLISLDDTLAPEPCLAESWSFHNNGSVAVFNLIEGKKFSDGTDFNAYDVVFSFNAFKKSGISEYAAKIDRIKSVSAVDVNTVRFELVDPLHSSISYFNFPIVSSSQFSSEDELLRNTSVPVVGTGLYMMESANLSSGLRLVPNKNHPGKVALNNITISIQPVEKPYIGFVKTGDIDMIIDSTTDREDIEGDPEIKIVEFTSNEVELLGFNCSGVFADKKLRQAVGYMIDRDGIIGAAYYNSGIKSDDLYYPGYYGTEIKNTYTPDDAAVKSLLAEAGYSDINGDGILDSINGVPFKVTLAVNAGNLSRNTAAELIATNLKNYGIDIIVNQIPDESYLNYLASGSYDMYLGGWRISEDYDLRRFYRSSEGSYAKYSNPKLDGYLDKLQSGLSTEDTIVCLNDIKEILDEDVPYLCLLYKTNAAAVSLNLQGIVAPRSENYYYGCNDWQIRVYIDDEDEDDNDMTDESEAETSENDKA